MEITIFSDGYNILNEIFETNLKKLPKTIKEFLIDFLPSICRYEEEETKIKPSLIVGIDINNSITTPGTKSIILIRENQKTKNHKSIIKSLLPLCNNGWTVFIDFKTKDKVIEYGIIQDFGGLAALHFTEMLFEENESIVQAVYFSALSNNEIFIKSDAGVSKVLDTRFKSQEGRFDKVQAINYLCEDCTSKLINYDTPKNNQQLLKAVNKLFVSIQQRLHGAILVVIDNNIEVSKIKILGKDSKLLPEPIDIFKYAEPLLREENHRLTTVEEYYAITELLVTLMNTDGVCIIDNAFRIRAYNTFVNIEAYNLSGGSRTRAFNTIKKSQHSKLVGCYFQSQDGYFECWRNKKYVKK